MYIYIDICVCWWCDVPYDLELTSGRSQKTHEHVRVPDKYIDKIYQYTQEELDISIKGSLPFVTILGPIHTLQTLPLDEVVPAFRFWVQQDVSSGADEGRTVDDLTASGGNYRTRIL